jgi:alpha-galactosidase
MHPGHSNRPGPGGRRRRHRLVAALAAAACAAAVALTTAGAVPSASAETSHRAQATAAAVDTLASTPPMGWNDWNRFGCDINEKIVRQTADAIVSSGLADDGYRYVNVDDCWEASSRDANGNLRNDPEKFPSGMAALADYVHAKGLKFGIYTAAGDLTCQHRPGSGGHYAADAQQFAAWGVDYVKFDWCGAKNGSPQQLADQFRSALNATDRPMLLTVSRHGEPWGWSPQPAQTTRSTADIEDNWNTMLRNVEEEAGLAKYAGPGHWNDPDMLEVGNGGLSATTYRAHFSLWSLLAAPLISGTDLRNASPQTLRILGNREVIAVDQDRAGVEGDRIFTDGDREVWVKPLADGSRAVVLFNRGVTARRIGTTARAVGLPHADTYTVRDLWAHRTRISAGPISAFVPPHGAAMYRISARSHAPAATAPLTTLAGSTGLLPAGKPTPVTMRLSTAGRRLLTDVRMGLAAPAGWKVTPEGHPGDQTANRRHPARATFTVTPPADANPGGARLHLTASYRAADQQRTSVRIGDQVVVPPPAPAGAAALSNHPGLESDNGWYMPLRVNKSFGDDFCGDCGNTLTLDGHQFATGLGTYASSQVSYYLGGACSTLDLTAGVDDEVADMTWPRPYNPVGTVSFRVYGDGHELLSTDTMHVGEQPVHRVLDVSGVRELKLVNSSSGDGNFLDHGDWAGLQASCS